MFWRLQFYLKLVCRFRSCDGKKSGISLEKIISTMILLVWRVDSDQESREFCKC